MVVLAIISLTLAWRFYSRRLSLPCPSWLSWLVELDNPLANAHKAAVIVEHLALKPGMNVIDIGCGPGRLTIAMARAVGLHGKIIALDIQQEMLRKVQDKAQRVYLDNIQYVNATIGSGTIRLENNQCDRATLVSVLGEIPNQKQALKEIFDILKPGGILSVTETMFDPHYQSKSNISGLAQQIGFEVGTHMGNFVAFTIHLIKPI